MRNGLSLIAGLAFLGLLSSGCKLPGLEGPVSRSLTTSREYSRQGVAAIELGQLDRAEELLAKAVKCCPEDPEARRNYAEALWRRNQRAKAVAQLEKTISLIGDDVSLHVRLAEMRLAMGQVEQAAREAEAALDLDPNAAASWATRARVLHAAGRGQAALADYQRALGHAPNDRRLLLEVAELYRELNEPQKALSMLHSLIDTYSPGEEPQQVLHLQGLAYGALGRHDDAVESLAAAVRRGQPNAELLYQLAEAQSRVGHRAEAVAAAEQALALTPTHQPSRRLLETLGVAQHADQPRRR